MAADHAAWLFAIAVGFVSAGLAGSIWELAMDEEPRFGGLFDANPTFATPFRVLVIVISAPIVVLMKSVGELLDRPFLGFPIFVASLLWSFLQGVFILTTVFRVS